MSPSTAGTRNRSRKSPALADTTTKDSLCDLTWATTAAASADFHCSSQKSKKRKLMGRLHNSGRPEPGDLNVMAALRERVGGMGCRSDKVKGKLQDQEEPGCDRKSHVRNGSRSKSEARFWRRRFEFRELGTCLQQRVIGSSDETCSSAAPSVRLVNGRQRRQYPGSHSSGVMGGQLQDELGQRDGAMVAESDVERVPVRERRAADNVSCD